MFYLLFYMKFKVIIVLILLLSIQNSNSENNLTDVDNIFHIGKMDSHNNNFVLFFKTRKKAILAKGEEFNYITDYPQDLYILYNDTGKTSPIITYDWFPKKVKELGSNYNLPVFPEDYAYYLLNDNRTLIMISGIKSIRSNFKFNLQNNELETLPTNNNYKLFVSSLLKNCGYKDINSTYTCSFYKPLISANLIN